MPVFQEEFSSFLRWKAQVWRHWTEGASLDTYLGTTQGCWHWCRTDEGCAFLLLALRLLPQAWSDVCLLVVSVALLWLVGKGVLCCWRFLHILRLFYVHAYVDLEGRLLCLNGLFSPASYRIRPPAWLTVISLFSSEPLWLPVKNCPPQASWLTMLLHRRIQYTQRFQDPHWSSQSLLLHLPTRWINSMFL